MKFSLSTLFWLALVAGISTGWWVDHQHNLAQMEDLQRQFRESRQAEENSDYVKVQVPPIACNLSGDVVHFDFVTGRVVEEGTPATPLPPNSQLFGE